MCQDKSVSPLEAGAKQRAAAMFVGTLVLLTPRKAGGYSARGTGHLRPKGRRAGCVLFRHNGLIYY